MKYKLSIKNSKSFDYKTSITEKLGDNVAKYDIEIFVPLKYLEKLKLK